MIWSCLEEYSRCCPCKWDGCLQNDGCNEQGHSWIGVKLSWQVCEPDDECCHDDSNVAESVANDMQDHGIHAHITMTMTVTALRRLLGKGVVVPNVNAGITARAFRVTKTETRAMIKCPVFDLDITQQWRLLVWTLLLRIVRCRFVVGVGVAGRFGTR